MTHREPPRAATLAAVLARALPDARPSAIAFVVGAMIQAAASHRKWAETCCNYAMAEDQQARGDRRRDRMAQKVVGDLRELAGHAKGGGCDDPEDGVVVHVDREGANRKILRTLRLTFGGYPRGPCGSLHISDMPGDGFGPGWGIYE